MAREFSKASSTTFLDCAYVHLLLKTGPIYGEGGPFMDFYGMCGAKGLAGL